MKNRLKAGRGWLHRLVSWPVARSLYYIGHFSERIGLGWLYQKAMEGSFRVAIWGGLDMWMKVEPDEAS